MGRCLQSVAENYPEYDFFFVNRQQLDLSDTKSILDFFETRAFDLILNCAAYTAVDKAESEPALANQVNHLALAEIANIAKQKKTKLIHLSTDYVFNGRNCLPYTEADKVDPLGVYGKTKLQGERILKRALKTNLIIIRTSWLYSEFGNNFVKTVLGLGQERDSLNVVFDQVGTPTYARDLAKAIITIIQSPDFYQSDFETDLFHFSNEGVCSWYDFAQTILELANIQCEVIPIETQYYPTPASRPAFSVLNKNKIKKNYTVSIPYWKDSAKMCLAAMQEIV